MERNVRPVAKIGAILGEGPIWDSARSVLRFVDIKGRAAFAFDPATGALTRHDAPGQTGWLLPADDGGWIAGLQDGLHRYDPVSGAFSAHRAVPGEPDRNRLNDACTAPDGSLWFGSMDDAEDAGSGHFYRYDRGQILRAGPSAICITNGPAIAPDGRIIYFTDTLDRRLHAAALGTGGSVGPVRTFARIEEGAGYPDGPTVDAEGCVWTGLFGGWGVRRYSPAGELLETVPLPVANCTKLAFGGADLRTAYVTTAAKGLRDADRQAQPMAGDLFAFDVDVPGCAVTPVALA